MDQEDTSTIHPPWGLGPSSFPFFCLFGKLCNVLKHGQLETTHTVHTSTRAYFCKCRIFSFQNVLQILPTDRWPDPTHIKILPGSFHYLWSNVNHKAKLLENTLEIRHLKICDFFVSKISSGQGSQNFVTSFD